MLSIDSSRFGNYAKINPVSKLSQQIRSMEIPVKPGSQIVAPARPERKTGGNRPQAGDNKRTLSAGHRVCGRIQIKRAGLAHELLLLSSVFKRE